MPATRHDIVIEQGATYPLDLVYNDENGDAVDLTGYTARMQVRETHDADDALLDFTTENGKITLGGAAGTITIRESAANTAALDLSDGPILAVYDLELVTPAGVVIRLLEGRARLSPEVTR